MAVVRARHPKRGEIHLVNLDPTKGREIKKTRPCLVISPDELNAHIQTVIVAPLTSAGKPYPFRVSCQFDNKAGLIVLDQIRTVDRERLVRRLGVMPPPILERVLGVLREMFDA
jgi:mRNA interferase MazF